MTEFSFQKIIAGSSKLAKIQVANQDKGFFLFSLSLESQIE